MGDLGPCWWEGCTLPATTVVQGVPVAPADPHRDELAATAARITRLGLAACRGHAELAQLAGAR